jgi:hypothetical protein
MFLIILLVAGTILMVAGIGSEQKRKKKERIAKAELYFFKKSIGINVDKGKSKQ